MCKGTGKGRSRNSPTSDNTKHGWGKGAWGVGGGGVPPLFGVFYHFFFGGGGALTHLPVAHGFYSGPWWACVTTQWLFVNPS